MAIIGIDTDRQNPTYTIEDYIYWIPEMEQYMRTKEGARDFNKLYPMANERIYYSIFGVEWEMAMSYCIAHYLVLRGNGLSRPKGSTLESATGGVGAVTGVITSMSVGGFSKTYDYNLTIKSGEDEALFWNQTQYGVKLYALMKSKPIASIFVVTNGNPYQNKIDDNTNNGVDKKSLWRF